MPGYMLTSFKMNSDLNIWFLGQKYVFQMEQKTKVEDFVHNYCTATPLYFCVSHKLKKLFFKA